MELEDLTPDQKAKVIVCKTPEELLALAKEAGYNLTDEELASVSGGWATCDTYHEDPCQTKGCVTNYWC